MLLNIQMPVWLSDFWAVYGEVITPILTGFLSLFLTWFTLKIRTNFKQAEAKTDTQILLMEQIIKKEDNKEGIIEIKRENAELKDAVANLSDMIVVLTDNTNIEETAKNDIRNIASKVKYGTSFEKIQELEVVNNNLKSELRNAKDQLSTIIQPAVDIAKSTIKKIRK